MKEKTTNEEINAIERELLQKENTKVRCAVNPKRQFAR